MRRGILLAVLLLILPSAALASTGVRPVTFAGNFTMGFPIDEFKDNVDEIALGGHLYATISMPGTPIQLGGSIGYMSQGSVKVETDLVGGGVIVPADVVTRNNVFMGHLILRLQHAEMLLRPYVDGYFGFGRYWTTTEVTVFGETEIQNHKDLDSWTANYGLGGGIMLEVYRQTMYAEEEGDEYEPQPRNDIGPGEDGHDARDDQQPGYGLAADTGDVGRPERTPGRLPEERPQYPAPVEGESGQQVESQEERVRERQIEQRQLEPRARGLPAHGEHGRPEGDRENGADGRTRECDLELCRWVGGFPGYLGHSSEHEERDLPYGNPVHDSDQAVCEFVNQHGGEEEERGYHAEEGVLRDAASG